MNKSAALISTLGASLVAALSGCSGSDSVTASNTQAQENPGDTATCSAIIPSCENRSTQLFTSQEVGDPLIGPDAYTFSAFPTQTQSKLAKLPITATSTNTVLTEVDKIHFEYLQALNTNRTAESLSNFKALAATAQTRRETTCETSGKTTEQIREIIGDRVFGYPDEYRLDFDQCVGTGGTFARKQSGTFGLVGDDGDENSGRQLYRQIMLKYRDDAQDRSSPDARFSETDGVVKVRVERDGSNPSQLRTSDQLRISTGLYNSRQFQASGAVAVLQQNRSNTEKQITYSFDLNINSVLQGGALLQGAVFSRTLQPLYNEFLFGGDFIAVIPQGAYAITGSSKIRVRHEPIDKYPKDYFNQITYVAFDENLDGTYEIECRFKDFRFSTSHFKNINECAEGGEKVAASAIPADNNLPTPAPTSAPTFPPSPAPTPGPTSPPTAAPTPAPTPAPTTSPLAPLTNLLGGLI